MDTYRIPTGCQTHENRTNHTRTGQTTYQRMSNFHPPYIFIRWRPFEVLNMSKTCQRIEQDKTEITWRYAFTAWGTDKKRMQTDTNRQIILLSVTRPLVLTGKVWQSLICWCLFDLNCKWSTTGQETDFSRQVRHAHSVFVQRTFCDFLFGTYSFCPLYIRYTYVSWPFFVRYLSGTYGLFTTSWTISITG